MDLAGNVDPIYEKNFNEYQWIYIRPLPVALIVGISVGFVGAVLFGVWYSRYRRRKKALERPVYARLRVSLESIVVAWRPRADCHHGSVWCMMEQVCYETHAPEVQADSERQVKEGCKEEGRFSAGPYCK